MPIQEHYVLFGDDGVKLQQIVDGTAKTIMLIATATEIPWTKPEDLNVTPELSATSLSGLLMDGFVAAIGDGSVLFIGNGVSTKPLHELLTIDGGEPVQFPE